MPSSAIDEDLWSPTRIALKTNQKDITQQKKKEKKGRTRNYSFMQHTVST